MTAKRLVGGGSNTAAATTTTKTMRLVGLIYCLVFADPTDAQCSANFRSNSGGSLSSAFIFSTPPAPLLPSSPGCSLGQPQQQQQPSASCCSSSPLSNSINVPVAPQPLPHTFTLNLPLPLATPVPSTLTFTLDPSMFRQTTPPPPPPPPLQVVANTAGCCSQSTPLTGCSGGNQVTCNSYGASQPNCCKCCGYQPAVPPAPPRLVITQPSALPSSPPLLVPYPAAVVNNNDNNRLTVDYSQPPPPLPPSAPSPFRHAFGARPRLESNSFLNGYRPKTGGYYRPPFDRTQLPPPPPLPPYDFGPEDYEDFAPPLSLPPLPPLPPPLLPPFPPPPMPMPPPARYVGNPLDDFAPNIMAAVMAARYRVARASAADQQFARLMEEMTPLAAPEPMPVVERQYAPAMRPSLPPPPLFPPLPPPPLLQQPNCPTICISPSSGSVSCCRHRKLRYNNRQRRTKKTS